MRIVVVGAGALGGLIGTHLTEAGEDVTFIEINEERAATLDREGIYLNEEGFSARLVPVKVRTSVEGMEPADLRPSGQEAQERFKLELGEGLIASP